MSSIAAAMLADGARTSESVTDLLAASWPRMANDETSYDGNPD